MPLVHATTDALNSWLIPMFGGNLELAADTDSISALATRNQAIWDRVEKATFLTDDEKRAAVGYGPLPKPVVKNTRRRNTVKVRRGRRRKDFDLADEVDALRNVVGGSGDSGDYGNDPGDQYPESVGDSKPDYHQVEQDEGIDESYVVDALAGLTAAGAMAALGGLSDAAAAGEEAGEAGGGKLGDAMQSVEDYLGGKPEVITNDDGDVIAMGDGSKIRFDINDPHGYDPHFHVEQQTPEGDWEDTGTDHMYFFKPEE